MSTQIGQETQFEKELAALLNRYSIENHSDTPDFIIARFLYHCLHAWNLGIRAREQWHGADRAETPQPPRAEDQ